MIAYKNQHYENSTMKVKMTAYVLERGVVLLSKNQKLKTKMKTPKTILEKANPRLMRVTCLNCQLWIIKYHVLWNYKPAEVEQGSNSSLRLRILSFRKIVKSKWIWTITEKIREWGALFINCPLLIRLLMMNRFW